MMDLYGGWVGVSNEHPRVAQILDGNEDTLSLDSINQTLPEDLRIAQLQSNQRETATEKCQWIYTTVPCQFHPHK